MVLVAGPILIAFKPENAMDAFQCLDVHGTILLQDQCGRVHLHSLRHVLIVKGQLHVPTLIIRLDAAGVDPPIGHPHYCWNIVAHFPFLSMVMILE